MAERDQEIVAAIHSLTEAFNRGDYEEATRIAHPDAEFVRSWENTPLRGPEAIRAWMAPEAFEDQHAELHEVTVNGDKVFVKQHLTAKGAGSGFDVDVQSWAVWTIDAAGTATRLEMFLSHEEAAARAAAGLPAR